MAQQLAETATSTLFAKVRDTPAVQQVLRRLEKGDYCAVSGVSAAAQPFLPALLRHVFPNRSILVVCESLKVQEVVQQDLTTWFSVAAATETREQPAPNPAHIGTAPNASPAAPLFYPAWEVAPHESRLPHVDVISERLDTLVKLCRSSAEVVVTNVAALLQRTFPRARLEHETRHLTRGQRIDPLDLIEWLEAQGYEPEAQVTNKGELSLRGGILDIFPLTSPWPVRLEFFGDELESMRYFDPVSQVSREATPSITVGPAGELGLLQRRTQQSELGTLLDYLPVDTIVVLLEPEQLDLRAEQYASDIPSGDPFFVCWNDIKSAATTAGLRVPNSPVPGMTIIALSEAASSKSESEGVEIEEDDEPDSAASLPAGSREQDSNQEEISAFALTAGLADSGGAPPESALFESLDAFRPIPERAPEPQVAEAQRREFFNQMHRWLRQHYSVHVFCNNIGERQRFSEIWAEYGLAQPEDGAASPLLPTLHLGTLARGFFCEPARVVVITDAEVFGRYKVQRPRRLKSPHAQALRSALDIDFTDLEEGDYVVHFQHGIGRYLGLKVLPIGVGTKPTSSGSAAAASPAQECLVVEYAPSDPEQPAPRLYVPVTEAHLVSKYVGTGKARPPLNTLGGTRWAKAKAQAERAVRDVASDLLSIQAARESQPGYSFGADTPWQREFEASFLFEETPDQMRAILEAKADMERPKPMDRLICGDVGFGKTEVGIRAAFKAVMDGKQVAVLVPTTVLAQQHYNTFRERMADYPVRVELLSRFRTRRAQNRVVKELGAGSVDIVIGTHRLLQGDIAFKDLGLVVIDEEQRFGVMHKEKFKMLRQLVDVLTLSATPIPRTLYLALTGARDMSTIQTPPHDRLPVETIVAQYDERLIRDAIHRELNRGGQVFFLHNRVMTIDTMARRLETLVPEARIVVGHGQMHSDDLEEVMTQFINGDADVLLSTTIIESGLDIPNANTIIIDRADRFGLSDLYQLRGRVGRYKHQAYAYLLLPRHASLLADARKRLSAIKQYSTLGSGFKIAMRDLEIRGAGNLLGQEQSGHITAVGFELYCQLLKQSVAGLKGEKIKRRAEVQVRLDFLALSATEEAARPAPPSRKKVEEALQRGIVDEIDIEALGRASEPLGPPEPATPPAAAYIPFNYIADARQRIEIYRKLATVSDKATLQGLESELRDRFGPLPPATTLLMQVTELKLLAADRGVTGIEVKEDKLMLTRNQDLVMVGNKFPRLTRKEAGARVREIRKLLLALESCP